MSEEINPYLDEELRVFIESNPDLKSHQKFLYMVHYIMDLTGHNKQWAIEYAMNFDSREYNKRFNEQPMKEQALLSSYRDWWKKVSAKLNSIIKRAEEPVPATPPLPPPPPTQPGERQVPTGEGEQPQQDEPYIDSLLKTLKELTPEQEQLFNKNVNYTKTLPYRFRNLDLGDMEELAFIALHRAVQSFDPTKAAFTTYVTTIFDNLAINYYRSRKKQRQREVSTEAPIGTSPDGEDQVLDETLAEINSISNDDKASFDAMMNELEKLINDPKWFRFAQLAAETGKFMDAVRLFQEETGETSLPQYYNNMMKKKILPALKVLLRKHDPAQVEEKPEPKPEHNPNSIGPGPDVQTGKPASLAFPPLFKIAKIDVIQLSDFMYPVGQLTGIAKALRAGYYSPTDCNKLADELDGVAKRIEDTITQIKQRDTDTGF